MNIESLKEEDVLNTRGANEAKAELTEVTDTISILLKVTQQNCQPSRATGS